MALRIKEVAKLAGITVRTLHYYDEIGLLKPARITDSGYRLYSDENVAMLQQILFFKELGFSLKTIKEIVHNPAFDRIEALKLHRKMLLEKKQRIDNMIETIDKTLKHLKGEIDMSHQEKFAGFDFSHNPYEEEARKRWGDAAVDEANEKINRYTKEEQKQMEEAMKGIFQKLASLMPLSPEAEEVQTVIGEWYAYLNQIGTYSPDAFKNLGLMYVNDERFTQTIDQFGDGLAAFMCDAMAAFAERSKP